MINKKIILKYSISILIVLCSFYAKSQEYTQERTVFIRPGIDVSRFALPYMYGYNYSGLEFSIDGEVNYKYFPIIEVGTATINDFRTDFNYEMNGYYGKIGMNYSISKYRHRLDRNLFYIGFRYGFSSFNDKFSDVKITNEWGTVTANTPKNNMSTHWGEALIGIKGEIFKNIFMGFSVRSKISIAKIGFSDYAPYIIPGFGKGEKTVTVGVNYTISYSIPIKSATINK